MIRRWIWSGVIAFLLLFSLAPTFYEIGRRNDLQPNRYFELVHNFYTDYNFYLSRIRQGREGAWTVTEKYTSEPHNGSYLHILYLFMGKVSAFVRVPWPSSGDTYHVGRIVAAVVLLGMMAHAAKSTFSRFRWQIIGFFLAATAGTWPILVYHANEWRLGGYMPWWTIMDVLQRTTFVPHMLFGQACIVFLLIAMTSERVMGRPGNWIFLGLIAFMTGIVFPPALLFLAAVFVVYIAIDITLATPWKKRQEWRVWRVTKVLGPVLIAVVSAPSLVFLTLALSVYPWKRIVDYALTHPQPFVLWDYVRAMGPMLPIGIVGIILVLLQKARHLYLFVAWVIAWAVLIVAFQYIPQESPLRFTEMLPHVPLGILGAYVVSRLWDRFGKLRPALVILLAMYGCLILFQLYSSWRWQKEFIDHKIRATLPLVPTGSYVMYPLKDMYDIMIYIQDHTQRTDVILTGTTIGNYLPVYAGNTAFVGHAGTVAAEEKEQFVREFYQGKVSSDVARDFIRQNNIALVVFGPQEAEDGGIVDLPRVYPFFKLIYSNASFAIFSP